MERRLLPEDYLEPGCPFCTDFYHPNKKPVTPIDLRRFIEKLDAHLGRGDDAAAERHLEFWRLEALQNNDERGLLCVENERMGFFRKAGRREQALRSVETALELVETLGMEQTITAATTWLNCATVFKTFGEPGQALHYYRMAQRTYEAQLAPEDPRLGGLYNNMALALTDLGRYEEARSCYDKALRVMEQCQTGKPERAITELNLADLAAAERGLLEAEAEIEAHLDRAEALLEDPENRRTGAYAFVCEKCAATFGFYGRFAYAEELKQRAEEIYAGT